MQKNTPNYTPNTHFGVLECPGGASGGQNLQGGVVGHFPPPMKFFQKFPDYVLVIRTYWGGLWEWFLTSPYYPPTLIGWAHLRAKVNIHLYTETYSADKTTLASEHISFHCRDFLATPEDLKLSWAGGTKMPLYIIHWTPQYPCI